MIGAEILAPAWRREVKCENLGSQRWKFAVLCSTNRSGRTA
jgi:hypothetical protein